MNNFGIMDSLYGIKCRILEVLLIVCCVLALWMLAHDYGMRDGSKDYQQLESAYKNGYQIIYKNQKVSSKSASSKILTGLKYNKNMLLDKNDEEKTIAVIKEGKTNLYAGSFVKFCER